MMWLPNSPENILVQLAASFCGVNVVAVRTADQIAALDDLQCKGLITNLKNHLSSGEVPRASIIPPIVVEPPASIIPSIAIDASDTAQPTGEFLRFDELLATPANDIPAALGTVDRDVFDRMYYYGLPTGVSEQKLLQTGGEAGVALNLLPTDRVCLPITLNHTFGFGSGVLGAIGRGAAVVLADERSYGRASSEQTYQTLASAMCTVLFADSHLLESLPEPQSVPPREVWWRGSQGQQFYCDVDVQWCTRGLVKIGSGDAIGRTDRDTRKWANARFFTVGNP